MGSELFALKEVFKALQQLGLQSVNFKVNSFSVCEKQPACLEFMHKNHQPKHLLGDMLSREVCDDAGGPVAESLMWYATLGPCALRQGQQSNCLALRSATLRCEQPRSTECKWRSQRMTWTCTCLGFPAHLGAFEGKGGIRGPQFEAVLGRAGDTEGLHPEDLHPGERRALSCETMPASSHVCGPRVTHLLARPASTKATLTWPRFLKQSARSWSPTT